MNTYTRTYPIK